jgi:hypothetical protein
MASENRHGKRDPFRKKVPLTGELDRGLLAYVAAASAAGMGMLALAPAAEAKIVYTRVNQPISGLVRLDLNHDGIPDFGLCIYTLSFSSCNVRDRRAAEPWPRKSPPAPPFRNLSVLPPRTQSQNQIWGNSTWRSRLGAAALAAGAYVGPKLKFAPGNHVMATWGVAATKTTYGGPWQNAPHRYLGLKFVISGKIHYGWARLNVHADKSGLTATLTGYAYETIPNKRILTGDIIGPSHHPAADKEETDKKREGGRTSLAALKKPPVAPASLGLLALGRDGLTAWRRRDNAQFCQG